MKTCCVDGYHVAGNEHVAIAISVEDPSDAHLFTPHTMAEDYVDMGAYDRAIVWTSPG